MSSWNQCLMSCTDSLCDSTLS